MIYFDNHATTPLDPVALRAMEPLWTEHFANPASPHRAGQEVSELVERALVGIANGIGAERDEIVVTSGATESNNLALLGVCLHPRQKRRHVLSVVTEHKAVLDPLQRLKKFGFEVELLPVAETSSPVPGIIDTNRVRDAVTEDTALVSVMAANNEIGVIQPLAEIGRICDERGALLHTDAAQALGRMPVDVDSLGVDLLSFSAHKFYGPKGIGGLYVRRSGKRIPLQAQILGGGQQHNLRSGTLNAPGIVGMAAALDNCLSQLESDQQRILQLRNLLWSRLQSLPETVLNGPLLDDPTLRLPGNLNCSFFPIEGQSLILAVPELAISSGSACTTANPAPSHVLAALGLTEEQSRSSLRFGIGRFNTEEEVERAAELLASAHERLRKLI